MVITERARVRDGVAPSLDMVDRVGAPAATGHDAHIFVDRQVASPQMKST
jgi:hypothetical protein